MSKKIIQSEGQKMIPRYILVHSMVGVALFSIPLLIWLLSGIPVWWIWVGFVAGIIYCSGTIPPYLFSRHGGTRTGYPKIVCYSDSWQTPLSPEQVYDAILKKFPQDENRESPRGDELHVFTGSELKFRKWGVFTQPGRNSIPLSMKVRARPNEEGDTLVSTEVRDNFGWYLEPFGKKLSNEVYSAAQKFSDVAKKSTLMQY